MDKYDEEYKQVKREARLIDPFYAYDPYPNGIKVTRCWLDVEGTYHEETINATDWHIKKAAKDV